MSNHCLKQNQQYEILISPYYQIKTMIFINPKTDYAFKKIFGSSESKDILISFLNALIYEGNSTIEQRQGENIYFEPGIV